MRTQRFGIEIELTGITREDAAKVIAEYFGTESYYIGTYYKTYGAKDRKGREWKATFDSSIVAQKKVRRQVTSAGDEYKCEIVSPILTYDDIPDLQEVIRQLRHKGAFASEKCGIHIHVDASRYTPQTLRNMVNIMASKEDILYRALQIDPARLYYCKKVNEKLIETINQKRPKTMGQLKDLWYAEDPNGDRNRHYNSTRYHGLNLHATFTKGTVEFRLFNSTTHAGEIKAYIQFCLAVSHQALTQKSASPRRTVTDNEKYAFRCWMLRLGLIGDEFKTCRLHFLKHLEGNSAWRHGA
ncbi:amidoligase family protein [Enterocloster clostridioformis]|uniref:amidoligase family protein n=1 Tax=Enterocloster clostridioformis TaxID=1531 RepID=UPI0022E5ACAE|nr:amidoligase family protein [Enterocloster clostridioformis]